MRPKIYLFGDSITEESFGNSGWGAALAHHFSRTVDVVLRGYSGYNTRWALKVLDRVFPPLPAAVEGDAPLAVTVFFGANDACLPDRCSGFQHVPLHEYKQNLHCLVTAFKKRWPKDSFLSPSLSLSLFRVTLSFPCTALFGSASVMADESIECGEFWLPPQFLEDDLACEGSDSSDLCSQVESIAGSGEEWSDEEDYLAGLGIKMARSTIEDDCQKLNYGKYKGLFGSCSPKSTLRGVAGSCGREQRFPPATVHVLCEDTGKVAPLRMSEQVQPSGSNRRTAKSDASFFPNQPLPQRQLQAVQLQRMRQQQMFQQPMLGQYEVVHSGPLGLQWPLLQQAHQKNNHMAHKVGRPGTMRPVFVRAPGARPCTGTGVFLPRHVGSQPQSRKKQGLAAPPPVLIPAKVVQALNMSFESMGSQLQPQVQPRSNGRFTCESDGAWRSSRKGYAEPRMVVNQEIQLPQEWTY